VFVERNTGSETRKVAFAIEKKRNKCKEAINLVQGTQDKIACISRVLGAVVNLVHFRILKTLPYSGQPLISSFLDTRVFWASFIGSFVSTIS
jgi:hypothetical protein